MLDTGLSSVLTIYYFAAGLLATAIGKMDGIRGYRGWRWVFILGKTTPY
jgi:hypothetical protein